MCGFSGVQGMGFEKLGRRLLFVFLIVTLLDTLIARPYATELSTTATALPLGC